MTIQTLQISYPDFQMGATIDPQQFDTNNGEIVSKINEIIGVTNNTITLANIATLIYPIGSIYMSVSSTNPSAIFGGTWVAWGNGRVPVGVDATQLEFDTVEKTGGEKKHLISATELPNHTHAIDLYASGGDGANFIAGTNGSGGTLFPASQYTSANGGNDAHNNLQPFVTCYMWKRTA